MGITDKSEVEGFDEKLREIEMELISEKSRVLSKGVPSHPDLDKDEEDLVDFNAREKGFSIGACCKALIFNEAFKIILTILCTEMGDRSQIAAVALAANYKFWIVAFAGSIGHIFALILAILFGKAVSDYTTEK